MRPKWIMAATAKLALVSLLGAMAITTMTGCSVFMAAKQPNKKDLGVLAPGMPRDILISELGSPISTDSRTGKRVDVFAFRQGYHKAVKVARAFGHAVGDVVTLFIWEVIGTPIEITFDGRKMAFEVTYDENDKVESIVVLEQ